MEISAVRAVSGASPLRALASEGQALPPGLAVAAKVSEITAGGLARLITAHGVIDVRSPVPLAPGTLVTVTADGKGGVTLAVPAPGAQTPAAGPNTPLAPVTALPANPAAPAAAAPAATGAATVTTGEAGRASSTAGAAPSTAVTDGGSAPAPAAGAAPRAAPPLTSPQNPLFSSVAAALQKQNGLGPLLANLAQAVEAAPSALPEPVRAAAGRILDARTPAGQTWTADTLKTAVENAGTGLERKLAAGVPPAATGPILGGDIKALLLQLKSALTAAWPEAAAETAAKPAAPGPTLDERPEPPRRGEPPLPQKPAAPDLARGGFRLSEVASRLIEQTEAALARVHLAQMASLPGQGAAAPDRPGEAPPPQAAALHADIPLALGRETLMLSLAVERDESGAGRAGEGAGPLWRLWFSIDLGAAGPVTALVTMQGAGHGAVGVTLWAEREATQAALRDILPDLYAELSAAAFASVDLATRPGQPKRKPRRAGGFLDTHT